jgi:hypothetical protein
LKEVVLHDGLPETRRIGDLLHLLSDDLGVVAVQLDALEGESPRGVGTRREGAIRSTRTREQHDKIVEFVVDARPRPTLNLYNLAHEPPQHVKEMDSGLVEKTASDAPVGHPGWIGEFTAIHLDVGRGGHKAGEDVLFGKGVDRSKATIVTDLIARTTRAARFEDLFSLAQGCCHRLFRKDVHVALQGSQYRLGMQRIGGADIHRLNVGFQERLHTGKTTALAQLRQRLCPILVDVCHANNVGALICHQVLRVQRAHVASANNAECEF